MMNNRPRRSIRPPLNLKEYVVVAELDGEDELKTLQIKKPLQSSGTGMSALKCKTCNVKFKNCNELNTHLKKHKGKENFHCEECGKSLSSFQAFSEHLNIHKNIKPYKCETCGHESRQLSVHTRHLLRHETNVAQTFKCSVCSKTFKQKIYLKQHMRKHLGEKPYACEECAKSFTAKTELNRHRSRHSSARPFACRHCAKKFKLKHNLSAHLKAHSGTQNFKCSLCKANFPQQCLMEKHKESHTEVIQHLELVKTDRRTLAITSFPLDRRKVLHHQQVSLPAKLDLNDAQNASNAKVSLGLSDALIPLSVIAASFGTGDYIRMKIVDQVNPKARKGPRVSGVTHAVLVDEEVVVLPEKKGEEEEEGEERDSGLAEAGAATQDKPSTGEELQSGCGQSVTSSNAQLSSHFESFEKTFGADGLDEASLAWLQICIDIVNKLTFPLHYLVCQQLHLVVVKVQKILTLNSCPDEDTESTLDLHAPSCKSCILSPLGNGSSECAENEFDNKASPSSGAPRDADKAKLRVQLCDSGKEPFKRGRLKQLYNFYTLLLELLQKHFKLTLD